jgi:hypothetical protein
MVAAGISVQAARHGHVYDLIAGVGQGGGTWHAARVAVMLERSKNM